MEINLYIAMKNDASERIVKNMSGNNNPCWWKTRRF